MIKMNSPSAAVYASTGFTIHSRICSKRARKHQNLNNAGGFMPCRPRCGLTNKWLVARCINEPVRVIIITYTLALTHKHTRTHTCAHLSFATWSQPVAAQSAACSVLTIRRSIGRSLQHKRPQPRSTKISCVLQHFFPLSSGLVKKKKNSRDCCFCCHRKLRIADCSILMRHTHALPANRLLCFYSAARALGRAFFPERVDFSPFLHPGSCT